MFRVFCSIQLSQFVFRWGSWFWTICWRSVSLLFRALLQLTRRNSLQLPLVRSVLLLCEFCFLVTWFGILSARHQGKCSRTSPPVAVWGLTGPPRRRDEAPRSTTLQNAQSFVCVPGEIWVFGEGCFRPPGARLTLRVPLQQTDALLWMMFWNCCAVSDVY